MTELAYSILITTLPYGCLLLLYTSYISSTVNSKLNDPTYQHRNRIKTAYVLAFTRLTFFLLLLRTPLWWYLLRPAQGYINMPADLILEDTTPFGIILKDVLLAAVLVPIPLLSYPILVGSTAVFALIATFLSYLNALSYKRHRTTP